MGNWKGDIDRTFKFIAEAFRECVTVWKICVLEQIGIIGLVHGSKKFFCGSCSFGICLREGAVIGQNVGSQSCRIDYLGKSDISSRRQIYGISIENSGWMRAVRTCTVALVADGDTVFGCRENFAGDGYRVFRFINLIGFQDGKRIFF